MGRGTRLPERERPQVATDEGGADDGSLTMVVPPEGPSLFARSLVVVGAALVFLTLGGAFGFMIGLRAATAPPDPPGPGPVATGFVQDLLPHHRQLVEMASWARDRVVDPEVARLAEEAVSAAAPQIALADGWRRDWGAPERPDTARLAWMVLGAGDDHDHGGLFVPTVEPGSDLLPGMASEDDMRALREADGQGVDVLFLQLLLRHHESGERMFDHAAQTAEVPEVRDLGLSILDQQSTETTRLRALLAARGAPPLPG